MSTITYAADVVVLTQLDPDTLAVLLIRRADDSDAFPGAEALPGGMVETDETSRSAAARELAEETGVDAPVTRLHFVGLYDTPLRDPRGRVVSAAWTVLLLGPAPDPVAGDDASAAAWVPVPEAFDRVLAFDHREILRDALAKFSYGYLAP